jgi:putative acetyltransferase
VTLRIVEVGLDDPRVIAMLKFHFDTNMAVTPPGSAHVFDLSRLKQTDVQFWSAWEGETLMGTGALKRMNASDGEVKSMHTLKTGRRSGVGTAILLHIIAESKLLGLSRLYLETGSFDYFAPARALYAKHGFAECGPFEGYKPDSNSTFMTRTI